MTEARHPMTSSERPDELGASAKRILDVAERQCAERGLEAVSMRDIASEAQVSLSVIYHHFGSKGNLLKSILHRRMAELNSLRGALFTELAEQAQPDLEKLLYAIIAPVALLRGRGKAGEITVQFLARVLLSTLPEIKEEVDSSVGSLTPLVDIAQRAVPHLDRREVCWRLHFTFGLEHMTHWDYERLEIMSEGLCDGHAVEESIRRAIDFAKAAFLAP